MKFFFFISIIFSGFFAVYAQYLPLRDGFLSKTISFSSNDQILTNNIKMSIKGVTTGSDTQSPDILLFGNFGNNIVNSFKGDNLYLHLAGVASTVLIITTNTDYYVHNYFYEHEQFGNAAMPIIRYAIYFPFVTGGSLYAYGKLNKDDRAVAASFAVFQSSIIALVYNSLLKAITGRPHPDWQDSTDMKSLSKTFRFGFLRGGVWWGWPSGHTSSMMAIVSALTNFYPEKTWLKITGYSLVAYMMFGVSSLHRGGMHWFSDAVAAALMSYAIGSTIGKYYRSKFQATGKKQISPEAIEIPLINLRFSF
jgi:membrane-associated phospholipid phosphatase